MDYKHAWSIIRDCRIILSCKAYSLMGKLLYSVLPTMGLKSSPDVEKLLSLKNRYKGKRIFIIGNGPSLKKTDIRLLKHEITIGCNGIFMLFDSMGFLPTFYTVEDTLVAEDRAEIIDNIHGTTKIFPYDLRYCLKQDKDTIFINFLRHYSAFPQFSPHFEHHVYWGGTVTYLNIQLAYYLGAKEIYLIGIDHNYRHPSPGDKQERNVITSGNQDPNHFHPDYFGPGFRYHDPMTERMELAYRKAKDFLAKAGVSIYNATEGGKLEVFPRVPYREILKGNDAA